MLHTLIELCAILAGVLILSALIFAVRCVLIMCKHPHLASDPARAVEMLTQDERGFLWLAHLPLRGLTFLLTKMGLLPEE